jgi:fucose permease
MTRAAPVVLLLSYLAFISLGLPDTVLGVAWPSLRASFGIPPSAMGAVLACGMVGYFSSGLWAGVGVTKLGVGGLLASSSALVAAALLGNSLAPTWTVFFPIGLLIGLGSGAIDSGLNGFAARHFSVRHINWLHACWGIGASTGPAVMTWAIAGGHGYRVGYRAIAAVLGMMAVLFVFTRRLWDDPRGAPAAGDAPGEPASGAGVERAAAAKGSVRDALGSGRVWMQLVMFFFYTGLESSVGQWCFSWMRERRGLEIEAAGSWTSAYWASLTLGRVVLGLIADRFGPDRLLRWASAGAVLGVTLFVTGDGALGRAGLLVLGASLAPMFPTLMARTPARVGEAVVHHAIGFQVSAATLGSVSMPALAGVLVSSLGIGAVGTLVIVLGLLMLITHEGLLRLTASPEPRTDAESA